MNDRLKWICLGLIMLIGGVQAETGLYLSPEQIAVSPKNHCFYVTTATAPNVFVVDSGTKKVSAVWTLKRKRSNGLWRFLGLNDQSRDARFQTTVGSSGVTVAPDSSVYVTAGGADGVLYHLSAEGQVVATAATGHTPMSPVVTADGGEVYVLNRFNHTVTVFDTATLKTLATIPVLREPVAAAMENGKLLFVANLLPAGRSTDDVVAAHVSVIDTAKKVVTQTCRLPNGSTGVRGICASPDGKVIYVSHTFGRYQLPTTQLERGWMNTAGLSIFNGKTGAYINTVLLDDVDLGAANPWGVTVSPDGKSLIVAHSGTHELSIIDRQGLHERLEKAAKKERVTEVTKSAEDVPNDLSFLVSLRRRIRLPGNGPRGIVCLGDMVYAALYYSEEIVGVPLVGPAGKPFSIKLADTTKVPQDDPVRQGEIFWNDATLCFQQWQSCASCHPDGRMDGLNWDLVNDGIGNPKQTKSMVYCHLTPPTMITGIRADMQTCNRKGLTHIQFVVRPEEDALCLDAYVKSIKPEPSPYLIKGDLSSRAKRGRKIYRKVGCAECHPDEASGPQGEYLLTNLQKYDLGLGVGNAEGCEFDTPTLVENWRTAPYLYDGRALTLTELLTTCNPKDTHGAVKSLTPEEVKDLVEYVLSF